MVILLEKKQHTFPESWNNAKIIQSIKAIGNTPRYDFRASDGTNFHVGVIDGVNIKVMKIGPNVTEGHPIK
ncbi:EndoU domain-containing protein [Fusobacterium sp. PH5-44]|uniref:EndoU domain-containing protein n=1 Tax=unclassified Fusobacterium TaxID=2648384 RepID=UPI003D1EB9E6